MRGGWYLMHRGWMHSGDFKPEPFTDREAYQWSIEQAAIKPHVQWFNCSPFSVERGEFVTSQAAMAAAFKWSPKRVRLFVARMVKAEKWAKRGACAGAKAPTVLVVVDYDKYQRPPREWGQATVEEGGGAGAKQGPSEGEEQKEGLNNGNEGKGRELESPPPARAPNLPYAEAVAIWTEGASAHGWKPLNPTLGSKRRNGLATILKVHGLDGWREGLLRAGSGEVLCGPDPPPWFNFDFATKPDNFLKLSEGNYDIQFANRAERSGWGDAYGDSGRAEMPA